VNTATAKLGKPKFEGVTGGRYVRAWRTTDPDGYLVRVWPGRECVGPHQLEATGEKIAGINAAINRALYECGVMT